MWYRTRTKELEPTRTLQKRLERSQPVLDAFSAWLKQQTPLVLPKSKLGKAVTYCLKQWDRLEGFLKDGRLEIDNNCAERSIKPFVIGRKAWLFSSVVKTAKENGLNPFHYLSYLFEKLPNIDTTDKEQLAQLLPWSTTLPQECRVPTKSK
ncbi:IS66 family transposase [Virgibacillus proomii]|uniref:IS66 family transposase n=1 Tax=Virgibacillus proomii TaxID=84407 RepID=UPI002814DA92|nr:transposase [Virgibacillus proomii]